MAKPQTHKRKRTGHYCWSCDSYRANDKFSGKRHARYLCRDCSRLGSDELSYRQALRNLERCVTLEGIIPRNRRKTFEKFLHHTDPRIRAQAAELNQEDAIARAFQRAMNGQLSAWDEVEQLLVRRESRDEHLFEVDPLDECNAQFNGSLEPSIE